MLFATLAYHLNRLATRLGGHPFPRRLRVTSAAASMAPTTLCRHGHSGFELLLLGQPPHQEGAQIDVVLPRCVAADLTGTLMALIILTEGPASAQDFAIRITTATAKTLREIDDDRDDRACCQAGQRTGGREHTCRDPRVE